MINKTNTFPPYLKEEDQVRLVSPAGSISPELIDGAEKLLSSWGYKVIRGEHVGGEYGRYSGTPKERLSDLQQALDDQNCSAIFCTRGGYGAVHLIDKISFDGFRSHPKWLVGYSDITMLHERLQMEGYASIHGGMAKLLTEEISKENPDVVEPASMLHDIICGKLPDYTIKSHDLNRIGDAGGCLSGGNLSILYSLRGTKYDFIPDGSILFIEDIGEKPYVVDRMMHNFKLGGIFERISGMIVGQFSEYEEDPLMRMTVYEIIADVVSEYTFPVCFDFPVGHVTRNLPLVSGADVEMHVNVEGAKILYIK